MIYTYLCVLVGLIGATLAFTSGDFSEMGYALGMAALAAGNIADSKRRNDKAKP